MSYIANLFPWHTQLWLGQIIVLLLQNCQAASHLSSVLFGWCFSWRFSWKIYHAEEVEKLVLPEMWAISEDYFH